MNQITQHAYQNLNACFTSDNTAGASMEILNALMECNMGRMQPYGQDMYSNRLRHTLSDVFETDVLVFPIATGSAANALALSALTPPWGHILCHPESHINNDECAAPEFFTGGAKLVGVEGDNGKIDPTHLRAALTHRIGDIHSTQAGGVSLTQAGENGQVYTLEELRTLGNIAHAHDVKVHMDGARFANALVELDCTPAEMTWKAGVDILSFGATKNGTLGADAIIVFDTELAQTLTQRLKRSGHLYSKMRFLSAQLLAYLENDLWTRNATHANDMAQRLKQGLKQCDHVDLLNETETNIVFCRLDDKTIDRLLDMGFSFYHNRWDKGIVRFVTSFATSEHEVDSLISAISTP